MSASSDSTWPQSHAVIARMLRALYPPQILVHAGWGNGLGELTQWTQWAVPHAWVIEAEESKASASRVQAQAHATAWHTLHATLAHESGSKNYHLLSNPSENGLLPAEALAQVWPHLQALQTQSVTTTTLDALAPQFTALLETSDPAACLWLIVDCLSAADILAAATHTLKQAHVLCARHQLKDRASLGAHMHALGWVEVAWVESNHPAVGHAWFTLDPLQQQKSVALTTRELQMRLTAESEAKQSLQEQLLLADSRHTAELAAKHEALAERDALAQTCASEAQAKELALAERDALAQTQTVLQAQLEAVEQAIAEWQAQLGFNSQAQSDLHGQLGAITQAQADLQIELDNAAQQQAQLAAERDALAQAKDTETAAKHEALAERDALAQTCATEAQAKELALAERDALAQAKGALQTQLEALTTDRADLQAQLAQRDKSHDELQSQLDAVTQARSELQAQLEAITQAQSHLQSKLDNIARQQTQLAAERDALAKAQEAETAAKNKAITERDALAKEKQSEAAKHKESQERLQQLESAHQDLQKRQHLQHEELVKAEAQIELIKDLLLREQGI